ncbi:flavodoxin family protein [Phocaeicola paurosaccharolyticus]|uniref:flavodoxin family protein n=1 Tax=Phocaeicola paurosaccharolyticus TaxID=732242 RepID=UPI000468F0C0|nr:flavodoxin family protein [Phocaeicola paurosaccharolyticus]
MKNVFVIKTSPRKSGNSDHLADEFIKGAIEAGNHVEEVSLTGKNIQFCRGCMTCQQTHRCVIKDDAEPIREKMLQADVIVWATPIYYYCVSGQMKTMIDRANPLYSMDYKFRDIYLLATAAEDEPSTVEGTVKATQGWVDCFGKATLKKVVFAGGVNSKGDIEGHSALKEAYELGKTIQ